MLVPTDGSTTGTPARTLAISLQLLPASRIAFSRCSSSAVHGVLVRPFFLGGAVVVAPAAGAAAVPSVGVGSAAVAGADGFSSAAAGAGEARRLRGFAGCEDCCWVVVVVEVVVVVTFVAEAVGEELGSADGSAADC